MLKPGQEKAPSVVFALRDIIEEREEEGNDAESNYYCEEEPSSSLRCGCFPFTTRCLGSYERTEDRALLGSSHMRVDNWVADKLKEAKEYSELLAGPRWKNIVRKVGKQVKGGRSQKKFHLYDAENYALNFDAGPDLDDFHGLYRNGSSRFPPTPPEDQSLRFQR